MQGLRRGALVSFISVVTYATVLLVEASAQTYPTRPIHILVGFTTGGAADFTARMVAKGLPEKIGQTVVVENRPGAGGILATGKVATSPADGYTLLLLAASDTIQPALRAKLPYDLARDLTPISLVASGVFVVAIHPSLPVRDIKEFIALARSRPGQLNYGSPGVGTSPHLAGELLLQMVKLQIVHVPFKGISDAIISTVSGRTQMVILPSPTDPFLANGKLRPIAVTTAKRSPLLPSVPTLDEAGLTGYDRPGWYGIAAPAGIPKELVAKLNSAINDAVDTPEMKQTFNTQGLEPQRMTPGQFAAFVYNQIEQNAKLVATIGITPE